MAGNSGKKMSPWAWVGIGCGSLLMIGLIVAVLLVGMCTRKVNEVTRDFEENPTKAAAEWAVRVNPDLELVSTDDAASTITVKDLKTGKEVTVDFKDAAAGRFTVESEGTTTTIDGGTGSVISEGPDGKVSVNSGGLEKMPAWFQVPAGVDPWRSVSHLEQGGKVEGMVVGDSTETTADLAAAFAAKLEAAGFKQVSKTENQVSLTLSYRNEARKQTVGVTITSGGKGRSVTVTYLGG